MSARDSAVLTRFADALAGVPLSLDLLRACKRLEAHRIGGERMVAEDHLRSGEVQAWLIGTITTARLHGSATIEHGELAVRRPLAEREVLVTLADFANVVLHPDFPLRLLPWLLDQLPDLGHAPLVIRITDGPGGRTATRE